MDNVEVPTDVLRTYYTAERRLYRRMVVDLGFHHRKAMQVIALWLWFEESGTHPSAIADAAALDDKALRGAASDAYFIVVSLALDAPASPPPPGFPAQWRDVRTAAVERVRYFVDAVCTKAFQDITPPARPSPMRALSALPKSFGDSCKTLAMGMGIPLVRSWSEGSSWNSGGSVLGITDAFLGNGMMPPAVMQPWRRRRPRDRSMEEKMLFITFSKGHPLREEDIYVFFMSNFGDVEMVEIPLQDSDLYAHVAFYSFSTIFQVLNGCKEVRFMYKGKHLRARRFLLSKAILHEKKQNKGRSP